MENILSMSGTNTVNIPVPELREVLASMDRMFAILVLSDAGRKHVSQMTQAGDSQPDAAEKGIRSSRGRGSEKVTQAEIDETSERLCRVIRSLKQDIRTIQTFVGVLRHMRDHVIPLFTWFLAQQTASE